MDRCIHLMIVDDHALMREGLKQIFSLDETLEVVAEAGSGAQALSRLRETRPDLLLLDMSMPGICGEALIVRIKAQYPQLPILVLSMYGEPQIARRALRCGALGYITKDQEPETLLAAIRRVAAGARYIDHAIAEQIVFAEQSGGERTRHDTLTAREHQILIMLAQGMGVNAIAETLAISNKTVSTHKSRLMDKMQFATNADIVKYALSQRLVP